MSTFDGTSKSALFGFLSYGFGIGNPHTTMMISRTPCRAALAGLGRIQNSVSSTPTLSTTYNSVRGVLVARRAYFRGYPSKSLAVNRSKEAGSRVTSKRTFSSQASSETDANAPQHKPRQDVVLKISKEVAKAILNGDPVVALETTIYTHGFPYPENLALAKSLEDIVRNNGATPATIGIIDGVAVVGMDPKELQKLCSGFKDPSMMKVSRRDLPYIMGMVAFPAYFSHNHSDAALGTYRS